VIEFIKCLFITFMVMFTMATLIFCSFVWPEIFGVIMATLIWILFSWVLYRDRVE
jgi:hypothetical protein